MIASRFSIIILFSSNTIMELGIMLRWETIDILNFYIMTNRAEQICYFRL